MKKSNLIAIFSAIVIALTVSGCDTNDTESLVSSEQAGSSAESSSDEASDGTISIFYSQGTVNGMPHINLSDNEKYSDFILPVTKNLTAVSSEYSELGDCTEEKFDEWVAVNEKNIKNAANTIELDTYQNFYSFMKEFNVSFDDFKKKYDKLYAAADDSAKQAMAMSDEQLEALRSMDKETISAAFKAESSIQIGEKCYSGKWIYYSVAKSYEEAGITKEQLLEVSEKSPYFNGEFPEEAVKAFEDKIESYS